MIATVVRGLALLDLAVTLGGLVVELILPAGAPDWTPARRGLRRLITIGIAVLALTTVLDLILRTQTMSRAPLRTALVAIPDVVTRTHFGAILAARVAMLGLALVLSRASAVLARVIVLLLVLAVVLTLSLTGHAADWGDLTASVAVDWAHGAAASIWTGGLLALAMVILRRDRTARSPALGALARRFSRLAGLCLLVVAASGVFNAWTQLGGLTRLWTTAYGRVLIAKVLIVLVLVWLGAVNRYAVLPRLGPSRAVRGWGERAFRLSRLVLRGSRGERRAAAPTSRLERYVAGEAGLAIVVFACTAVLGEITPGRHVAFERKPTTHVTNAQPRPSAERSRPANVTVPSGDASRGRAVFVTLKCFTCHAVRDEHHPPATRPGPDLSTAGSHPAGYLLESIVNPNALALDGPGYTDERGRSIMPEYRQNLTVGELIDLVAYLRTLGATTPAPEPAKLP